MLKQRNLTLNRVLVSHQADDLEARLQVADSHDLLTIVPAVVHQGVHKSLSDGALGLVEINKFL